MQRKLFSLFTVLISLSLLLALMGPGAVFAQDEQPPTPSPRPPQPNPLQPSADHPDLKQSAVFADPVNTGDVYEAVPQPAQSLTLGQPGLSFRYLKSFGVTGEPYLADGSHINQPNGLFISGNNLFVAEEVGNRILKFNLANPTTATLTIGHAGLPFHHDDYLSYPRDVAVRSGNGHIWIVANPFVKEFDANGVLIQSIPPENPWETGSDNLHFDDPYGIAFGPNGYLFVSDQWNHRIQIYNVSGPAAVYVGTIGTAGIPRSDNSGFDHPMQIAFDTLNRLYVMDINNRRVQRCTSAAPWTSWTCSTFFGQTGVEGDDLTHLSAAEGIGIDASNNVFIADGLNFRVLKCNTFGICSLFAGETDVAGTDNAHFNFIDDVAIDASGNVYISDTVNDRVQKFNSAGVYQSTIGVTGIPYVTDATRLFGPWGITVAPDGSIYTVEKRGTRLIKMNAAGVQQWTVGEPGIWGSDNTHFGSSWCCGLEGNLGLDASGRVYVSDTQNNRVQIYNPNGTYFATLGNGWGQGDYEFSCPAGVGISPVNGDVYVLDRCNQRVQVYTSGLVYKATLGETAVEGSDNFHFKWPYGVTIAPNGSIFISDSDNFRVQKCNFTTGVNYTCSTFAGQTGMPPDGTYDHMYPVAVTVDVNGRVYVADDWNSRIQVYDAAGAYLTTIGGEWSGKTGGLINPFGIALDSSGNVYVADHNNHRIQKFARGVPGWQQVNLNGFGTQAIDMITTFGTFKNNLFAGTSEWNGAGAQIWYSANGTSWARAMAGGFGNPANYAVDHLLEFNGYLYAGTWSDDVNGGEVWRSSNGTSWTRVVNDGFGNVQNSEVYRFQIFNNMLYASAWNDTGVQGGEIWRTSTGNAGGWAKVVSNGFNDPNTAGAISYAILGSNLYVGTFNSVTGGNVLRTDTGNVGDWQPVSISGFGTSDNTSITALAVFNGYLYAGTNHVEGGSSQIWRCQVCDNSDWENVTGSWSVNTRVTPALEVKSGMLYAAIGNFEEGLEVWQTKDGTSWEQVGFQGFEGSNNPSSYWDQAFTLFKDELYLGTRRFVGGGQIWRTVPVSLSGSVGVAGATLSYNEGAAKTVTSLADGSYAFAAPYNWSGTVTPSHACFTFSPASRDYSSITANQTAQTFTPTLIPGSGCANINVLIAGSNQGRFGVPPQGSTRASFTGLNNGPVKLESTSGVSLISAERLIYKVNGVNTSFTEMMGLPNSQLDKTYWLPWYNNVDLDTQLRFANVTGSTATVHVLINGVEMAGSPFTLAAGASTRKSFAGINNGPVQIVSNQNLVAAERLIYKVNGLNTSFTEMMALPNSQLNTTYWLPWYNNKDLDTQLRFANVSGATASVHVYIGGVEMTGSPFTLLAGESIRKSFSGVNAGPVKIVSDQNIVAAERLIYKVNGVNTSFSEMMALPNNQLNTTYWLPWYNNKDLDTQLRFANVSSSTATVHVYIGGVEMTGSPFTLLAGESTRQSFPNVNNGPVQIVSNQNIVAAERLIYKVNNINTSFSEMMALPNSQLDTTYWLPWYNNVDLDTQLRFGVP